MVELKDRMLSLKTLMASPDGKQSRLTDLLIRAKVSAGTTKTPTNPYNSYVFHLRS